ncbi:MAG: hypothetical protein ABH884_00425 [Candidatus Komeilibacteria bacterium]
MRKNKMTLLVVGIIFVLNSILVWLGAWTEPVWLNWLIFIVGIILVIMALMGKKSAAPAAAPVEPVADNTETPENM